MQTGESGRSVPAEPSQRSRAKRNPNNLPPPLTRFIGRVGEIAEVRRLVMSNRLLTLTGPGGCGKTRLAVAIAHSLLRKSAFEHGIWFVELAGLDTSILLPQLVATTVGVPEAPEQSLIQTLTGFLQKKRLLVILDNCEHLLRASGDLVQPLLEACPTLHILATSREPLNLPLEMTWLVPSMALPDVQSPPSFEQLAQSEAIQLFAARARTVLPGFSLNEKNVGAIVQICRRLDGIPLAIELAAARVKLLDVEQIADRLADSLQLLTHGSRGAAPRHQTMRAALDWSYALLLPREQRLFQRLAVFAGGFSLDAAEAVCADGSAPLQANTQMLPAPDVLDVLTALLDKSLVVIAERSAGEPVRYRLLEPIRQYALEALRQAAAEQAVRDQHLAYFVQFAERAEQKLKSQDQVLWLARLDKEHDNLRAALAWSAQPGRRSIAGLRIATALHLFWQRRGHWSEGRGWLNQVISSYQADATAHAPGDDVHLARALVARGWLAVYLHDYGAIRASLELGLELAREASDRVTQALALGLLSFLSSYVGDPDAARQLAEASVERARGAGDDWSLAWALHVLGRNRYYRGDVKGGQAALAESESLYRRTGDKRSLAIHINTLAIIAQNAGEFEMARHLYEEALAIGKELADQDLYIKEISNLGGLALIGGNRARAKQLYEQVLAQARDLNIKGMIMGSLTRLSHIHMAEGDWDTARHYLRESLPLAQEMGHEITIASALTGLARIAAVEGHLAQAATVIGAVDRVLTARATPLDADDDFQIRQDVAAVRAALTPEEFESAFAAGHTFTLEQAMDQVGTFGAVANRPPRALTAPPNLLRLCALGAARVFQGEQPVTAWAYARVKELLFYLALHPSRSKAQIGLALWPDASPAQLRHSLATSLYHLRRALGNTAWIVFEDDQYRFNRALAYQFDVELFESNLAQASYLQRQMPERARALLEEALSLYQGDFVEDFLEGEWFLLRREELRLKYLAGLLDLGQLLFEQGSYARAAQVCRRAIDEDAVMESAHRALMRCYARLGERGQALRQYQALEQIMRDELGSPPAAASLALYEQLMRGEEI